jgi:hypothetical protein
MSLNLEQMKLSGFEPDQNLKWEKIGKIPAPDGVDQARYTGSFVSSVAIDEHRVLAIDQPYSDSIWESFVRVFDTRTRKWSNEAWPSLNQPRNGFVCVLCDAKVYVIGGLISDQECSNSIECLDLSVSPRRWRTMDQRLETARYNCTCVAIGKQIFILGGSGDAGELASVEILNTQTGQLVPGPDLPQAYGSFDLTAGAVNNKLFVFARSDGGNGKVHTLQQAHPSSTWFTTSCYLPNEQLVCDPIVIGDCVALTPSSVYDMNRGCWWDLPLAPSPQKNVVNGTEIVAITEKRIYSLKLKFSVQPPSATVFRHTKTMLGSMLFSPKFSDVTLVCPDGTEIPAHQVILSGNSLYFDTYFSGLWAERHPDGRLQTEMTQDVIKPLLSLMYTGEILLNMNDSTLVGLLEAAYQLQLNDDLLRVCQKKCIDKINDANVKEFLLLSAKPRNATFLFDACFKYVCEHLFEIIGKDPVFAGDVTKVDDGQLWRDIFESAQRLSRKRPREDSD